MSKADFLDEIKNDITDLMEELFEMGFTGDDECGQKANNIRQKLILETVKNRKNTSIYLCYEHGGCGFISDCKKCNT